MNPLIEKYFESDLNPTEKKELEENLIKDSDLQEEFQFHQALKTAIHQRERQKLKDFLESLEKPSKKKRNWWLVSGIAAAVLLALSLLFLFPSNREAQLAKNHFQPLPNMIAPTVRGNETAKSEFNQAFDYYDQESYLMAADEFLKPEGTYYSPVYAGVSYMAAGKYKKSIEVLNTQALENMAFESYRKWYLGLAYLKTGEKELAIDLFGQLTEEDNPVQDMATSILSELE